MRKKTIAFFFAALLFCFPSVAQEKVPHQRDYRYCSERINGIYIPRDIDEAVDSLDTLLSEEDKRFVADSLSLEKFCIDTHFGIGGWMRNAWGLWSGSRLQRFLTRKKVYHPDDMSYEILKAYYKKKIQGLPYSADKDITPDGPRTFRVVRSRLSDLFSDQWRQHRKEVAESRREFKKNGCKRGTMVYYQYPYGYSTAEERGKVSAGDALSPTGKITGIDYGARRIKVKLLSAASPYGIIVYDGDLLPFDDEAYHRDYDSFTPLGPSRFYMQPGDELWFDLESDFWRFEE